MDDVARRVALYGECPPEVTEGHGGSSFGGTESARQPVPAGGGAACALRPATLAK